MSRLTSWLPKCLKSAKANAGRRDPAKLALQTLEAREVPATLVTDQLDYGFGEVAAISGSGFAAGEVVTLQVTHAPGTAGSNDDAQNQPFVVTADADGNLSASWTVDDPDADGASYILSAIGAAGSVASTTFTDGNLSGVAVASQTGTATYGTSAAVTYSIDVTGSGGNPRNWALTVSGLPTGVSGSFSPSTGSSFAGPNDSVLTLTTTGTGSNRTLPGTYTFTVTVTAGSGTGGGPFSTLGALTVGKKALTVSGVTANDRAYDGTTGVTLNTGGAALSGLVAGDSVNLNTGGATGTFGNKNVGTAKTVTVAGLTLSGAEAGRYTLSQPTTTASITPKAITGSFAAANKTYDGTAAATILTRALSGVVPGDVVTYTGGTATFADKNVGTGKTVTGTGFALGGSAAGNYTVNSTATTTADITALAITGSFAAANKTYDGTAAATILTRALSGVVPGDVVTYTGGTATFADKNVGTGKTVTGIGLSLSGGDAGNYTVNATAATTADITVLTITGSFAAANKTYDGTADATIVTRSLFNWITGDDVQLIDGAATFADKNVGTGKTVTGTGFALSGADAGNYALASATLTATADIAARHITGSFTATNKTYDGGTSATVLTRSVNGAVAGDAVSLDGGTAAFADKNAGAGKTVTLTGATLSGADAGNYVLDSVNTTTASINALHITGSFTAANKFYDGTTAATITGRALSGVVVGDDLALTGGTATFASKDAGTWTVTGTGFALSGADAGNYALDSVSDTTAAIFRAVLTGDAVTQDALNLAKQGTLTITVSNISGLASSETTAQLAGATFYITIGSKKYAFAGTATVLSNNSIVITYSLKNSALLAEFGTDLALATSGAKAIAAGFYLESANYTLSDDYLTRLFSSVK